MPSNLHGLAAQGVSIWSDQISRKMLDSGELARRVEEDAVSGVTSNPTIFAKAIVGSDEYNDQLADLRSAGLPTDEIARNLMASDIARACDVLGRVYEGADGSDGFVSVEVSPVLADDTHATIEEAREWVKAVDRPNLLVKVPATPEGIPAIKDLTAEGISVNITLIFSLQRYEAVIDAYFSGLEEFAAAGGDLRQVFSVASFFVSRFDSEVDPTDPRRIRRLPWEGSPAVPVWRRMAWTVPNGCRGIALVAPGDHVTSQELSFLSELGMEIAGRNAPVGV